MSSVGTDVSFLLIVVCVFFFLCLRDVGHNRVVVISWLFLLLHPYCTKVLLCSFYTSSAPQVPRLTRPVLGVVSSNSLGDFERSLSIRLLGLNF